MLPYLERFAPTRGHKSGFQMLLVFDDCGITLEIFVRFIVLLSDVLRATDVKGWQSGRALLPSEALVAGVEGNEGRMGFFYAKNHPEKTPKHPPSSFFPRFFCFVLLRNRKEQDESMSEYLRDVKGGCSASGRERRVLTGIAGGMSVGNRSGSWALSLAVAVPAWRDPAAVRYTPSLGTKGPFHGHRGRFCGSGAEPNLGARVELASMVTDLRRWI